MTSKTTHKSVTTLNHEFERAHAAFKAMPPHKDNPSKRRKWERALDRCHITAARVVLVRAETIEEMLIKSRVIVWRIASVKVENIATWRPINMYCDDGLIGVMALGKDLDRIAKRLNVEAA
ncbi:MAG TPA: hypothetical protein VIJ78_10295 [Pseudolabrys sp.]